METHKLIRITADDGGNEPKQDELLLRFARARCVSGVSFFVNMMPVPTQMNAFLAVPGFSVGMHLNLTDGRPVSRPSLIPSLVNREGAFPGPAVLFRRWMAHQLDAREVKTEVEAQVRRFRELFGRMDHVDSHRHVHRFPGVARALAEVLPSMGLFPRTRCLNRCVVSTSGKPSSRQQMRYWLDDLKRLPGVFLKKRAHRHIRSAKLPMEDGLLTPWPGIHPRSADAAGRWAQAFAAAPAGRWEANFHPGWHAAEAALLQDSTFVAARSIYSCGDPETRS